VIVNNISGILGFATIVARNGSFSAVRTAILRLRARVLGCGLYFLQKNYRIILEKRLLMNLMIFYYKKIKLIVMKNKQYLENSNFDSFEKIKSKKKKNNDNDFTNKNNNKKINVERGGKRFI
jgi:hypothetical protein